MKNTVHVALFACAALIGAAAAEEKSIEARTSPRVPRSPAASASRAASPGAGTAESKQFLASARVAGKIDARNISATANVTGCDQPDQRRAQSTDARHRQRRCQSGRAQRDGQRHGDRRDHAKRRHAYSSRNLASARCWARSPPATSPQTGYGGRVITQSGKGNFSNDSQTLLIGAVKDVDGRNLNVKGNVTGAITQDRHLGATVPIGRRSWSAASTTPTCAT